MSTASVPVLVVDDDAHKRLALKSVLAPLGYSIVEAESGEAALRCVMATDFAVILLDVRMPGMNGFETAALMRRRKQSEMTPIIFITAFAADELGPDARYVEGAVDFIFSPVHPDELRAKVSVFAKLFTKAAGLASRAREVQTSADQLRLLTDAAPVGIFQTDKEDRYLYTNPRWTDITGISAEEALGRDWATISNSEERPGSIHVLPSTVADPTDHSHRLEIRVPGGPSRIALVTSESIPDARGRIAGWVGTLADVTAEAGADAERSASERRFRQLADAMPQIVWTMDPQGEPDYFNERWFDYTGLSMAQSKGGAWASVMHPDDSEALSGEWAASMEAGTPLEVECRFRRVDGEYRWHLIRGMPVRDDRGEVTKWFGTSTDIHEQKRAEESLRTSEQLFRGAFDAGQTGIALIDADGTTYLDVNDALCEMLGYTKDELVSLGWAAVTHPDDRQVNLDRVSGFMAGQRDVDYVNKRYIRKDGETISVQISDSLIRQPDGPAMYCVTHVTDVTEREEAALEKEKLQEQLRQAQKMEAVGQLAGGVAHDFNNILAVVLNYAEFVTESLDAEHVGQPDLQQIIKAGERGAVLVHQLLAFSRQEVIELKVLDLDDVVSGMAVLLSRSVGEDIELNIEDNPDDLPLTKADRGQMEQILLNLVVNARDAMPDGGRIDISTGHEELEEGARADLLPGHYVKLTVTDNGSGIDPDTLEHIFEPFFTTKERGEGTGLGLATTYGIVKRAGGGIYVESEVGEMTAFTVYLPVTTDEIEVPVQHTVVHAKDEATILVVEDEAPVRELIGRILRRKGFTVLDVSSGAKAVEICADPEKEIDLLLTDVVMPLMSGPALRDAVHLLRPDMSVLFMSGYTDELIAKRGVLGAGEALLSKPFNSEQLLERVRDSLQSRTTTSLPPISESA
ncbi:MAG TPA: PAS domain S-box protein [Actinomycetota bacterium]|nr:PAS domain S-box protein [Actinomycetota bacterium]